jgi:hypothetical protein
VGARPETDNEDRDAPVSTTAAVMEARFRVGARDRPDPATTARRSRRQGFLENDLYDRWAEDAELLVQVGRALFEQDTRVKVWMPRRFAERAVEEWRGDRYEGALGPETVDQE